MKAQIVIGLGFGDEGKGVTTDYLCSQNPNSIVVRFSGGQQAGHTVIHNDIKHVHSNYCSGSLRGLPSYFSEHCSIYLNTIDLERRSLACKNVFPTLIVHPLAKITTPYDVAYNRTMESKVKHGSCGLGIAATMKRHNETGFKLFAIDLINPAIFSEKLMNIATYYDGIIKDEDHAMYLKYASHEVPLFYDLITEPPVMIRGYEALCNYGEIIFEGSQGIMLDKDHGIFPNVTYANTTSKNAIEICDKIGYTPEIFYVTRCYQTRHGNGWMSNYKHIPLTNTEEEINIHNKWQGHFKISELDYNLLNYALEVDRAYHKRYIRKNLVVTCLDQRPGYIFDNTQLDTEFENTLYFNSPKTNDLCVTA